jgi:hypothetical protein
MLAQTSFFADAGIALSASLLLSRVPADTVSRHIFCILYFGTRLYNETQERLLTRIRSGWSADWCTELQTSNTDIMKKSVVLCLAAFASANIIFKTANLRCDVDSDRINYGCMPGTQCNEDHTYVSHSASNEAGTNERFYRCTFPSLYHPLPPRSDVKSRRKRDDLIYSIDGKCGVEYGDRICDPSLSFYDGTCCSEEGYCGNSDL